VRTRTSLLLASILSLGGLAVAAAAVPVQAAANASTITFHKPHGWAWKPGTALPNVPAGYKLIAWPNQTTLAHIRPGHSVPTVAISASRYRSHPAMYQRMENAAGLVNLEAVYSPGSCVPGVPVFKSDIHSEQTRIAQSYSTISGMTQNLTYTIGQVSNLEFGVSLTGDTGTWSGTGTLDYSITDSSGSQQGFTPQTGVSMNHWITYFEWGKYEVYNSCPTEDYYQAQAYQWDSGTAYETRPEHPAPPSANRLAAGLISKRTQQPRPPSGSASRCKASASGHSRATPPASRSNSRSVSPASCAAPITTLRMRQSLLPLRLCRMRTRILLGALPASAVLLAACSSAPPPLGNGGDSGSQCVPSAQGRPVSMGFYTLENTGSADVTIKSVVLPSAHGLTMTRP
jgi:hypothetical protein